MLPRLKLSTMQRETDYGKSVLRYGRYRIKVFIRRLLFKSECDQERTSQSKACCDENLRCLGLFLKLLSHHFCHSQTHCNLGVPRARNTCGDHVW